MHENGDATLTSNVKFHAMKVRVTPTGPALPSGEIPCDITYPGHGNGGTVKDNRIILKKGEGPFCLQFDLQGLDWATDEDPIWVQEGTCPTGACSPPEQVWVWKEHKDRVATMMDMNVGDQCELHYRLNFANGQFCDPVIENGGGNIFD